MISPKRPGPLDRFLESTEWLCTGEETAIDEKGWRAAHANFRPIRHIFIDCRYIFPTVQAGVEFLGVEL